MRFRALPLVIPVALLVAERGPVPASGRAYAAATERVVPNDNRVAGGSYISGVLQLRLEARVAEWHPDGEDAPGAEVMAFAEEGGPARIPGPLLRVPAGTMVDAFVRNRLADTLELHGLFDRLTDDGAPSAPLRLAPGDVRRVRFRLDVPGTYFYWGTTMRRAIDFRTREDAQLTGAIVVDDPASARADDRVLVIGMWTDTVARSRVARRRVLGVINGRSWPATERLAYAVGDTVRWRLVNASADLHPMHLHGFFFRVDARGDLRRDTTYAADARDHSVTENMGAGETMRITWVPEREGNWLFHCHIPEHFAPRAALGFASAGSAGHGDHARGGMSGLVMGIAVEGREGVASRAARAAEARRLRLLVRAAPGHRAGAPRFTYALQEPGGPPPPDAGSGAAPTLDLARGEPVRIMVVNRLAEPTAVHWHGIELESVYDGVPGFSGIGPSVTPLIAPGDSFEVRFTPPRAGTFIYHTHADEERQQVAGLAGALLVHAGSRARDAARDLPLVLGEPRDSASAERTVLVNGADAPAPLEMVVGTTYRLRIVQMTVRRAVLWVDWTRDGVPQPWQRVAKDGADLAAAAPARPGRVRAGIGETYDFLVRPDLPGEYAIEIRPGALAPARPPLLQRVPVRVRAARAPAPD